MPFTEKYKPKNLKEFVDQKEAVEVFLKWISKWKPGSNDLIQLEALLSQFLLFAKKS